MNDDQLREQIEGLRRPTRADGFNAYSEGWDDALTAVLALPAIAERGATTREPDGHEAKAFAEASRGWDQWRNNHDLPITLELLDTYLSMMFDVYHRAQGATETAQPFDASRTKLPLSDEGGVTLEAAYAAGFKTATRFYYDGPMLSAQQEKVDKREDWFVCTMGIDLAALRAAPQPVAVLDEPRWSGPRKEFPSPLDRLREAAEGSPATPAATAGTQVGKAREQGYRDLLMTLRSPENRRHWESPRTHEHLWQMIDAHWEQHFGAEGSPQPAEPHGIAEWSRELGYPTVDEILSEPFAPDGRGDTLTPEPETAQIVKEARELIAFLDGSAPLFNVWFGERMAGNKGLYWWRNAMRIRIEALLALVGEEAP